MNATLSSLLFASLGLLTACGGAETPAELKVRLTANDQMKFDKEQIVMKLGQTLVIDYENVGSMPKETMGHNLVILKSGVDSMNFGLEAVKAKDTDYIPPNRKDEVLAWCKVLGPGEKTTVNFKPEAAGKYPYLCAFPGHVGTMRGTIVVKRK